ncbi:ATP cone domain-containing protein [Clostridium sp. DL1XJH146]
MKVIKRDGRIEEFNSSKINTSIMRASDDAKEPFNSADIEVVSENVIKALGEKDEVAVYEIHMTILSQLKKCGFSKTAESFDKASTLTD